MASLPQLTAAAKKAAKANGFALDVARSACLSGCSTGPTALLESDQGVVRLQAMVDTLCLSRAVAAAATLISPAPVPAELGDVVLSRLLWAQLEHDQLVAPDGAPVRS
ncbi:MAG: hypothetical protein EXR77_04820 [Myxococcales bacterium]|nr:hypothetical protein [Myxococcales bacterium]